jgi:hypothetical protein
MRLPLRIFALILGCSWSLLAQDRGCQSVLFTAKLADTQTFEHELGNGIWFVVYPSDGYWTIRIGRGRKPENSSDLGWSLDDELTSKWLLGSDFFDAAGSMKESPRHLWFALTEKDFELLTAARQYVSGKSTHSDVQSGEHDPDKVIAEIPKGLVTVVITDYQLSEPREKGKWHDAARPNVGRDVASVSFEVTVNTPPLFPLTGAVACACPSEMPDAPDAGYVPDSVTAIKIAEAVMGALYGEKETRLLRPYTATLDQEVWTVVRHCESWCAGPNPTVKILKQDGRIISMRTIYLK